MAGSSPSNLRNGNVSLKTGVQPVALYLKVFSVFIYYRSKYSFEYKQENMTGVLMQRITRMYGM